MIRRPLVACALMLATTLAVGCAKKEAQNAPGATSDSLLSANPVEQPQGQITPQTGMQPQTTPPPAAQTETPKPVRRPTPAVHSTPAPATVTVPGGTEINVTMGTALTSETAQPGESWSGTINQAVTVGSAAPFPAGSTVTGVVEGVAPAAKGDRAYLVLRVTSIESNGSSHQIDATADSLIAGSTRKRNVGAVVGGAAAGALLGRAIGGSTKGAVIGGILGGAAATGAVAASKGFQVSVPQGKDMVFKVDHDTKVRL